MSETPPARPQMDFSLFGDDHVRLYRETKGEQGYWWNGAEILLLTTTGRRSGQARTIPLIFVRDGDEAAIIASKGGAPANPAWYENLAADPHVSVQIKDDVFQAVARTVSGAQRQRIWAEGLKVWPFYDDYQAKTDREIPVVLLERVHA